MSMNNKSPMIYTDTHVYFLYSTHVFSNFYPCKFGMTVGDDLVDFNCSEQAYMFWKARQFGDIETANEILLHTNPYECKRLGREIKGYDDAVWCKVRMHTMFLVNFHKFNQNPDLLQVMLDTGNRIIVEASSKDLVWGSGVKIDDPELTTKEWTGDNRLGYIHGKLRSRFRAHGPLSFIQ